MFKNIIKRTYKTIRSSNDEQANQALLGRLRRIPNMNEKKVMIKGNLVRNEDSFRHLTLKKLSKLIELHTSDPLIWDSSTLGRIFRLPQDICENLIIYTRPFGTYVDRTMDEPKEIVKTTSIVVDLSRMKSDKNYLISYKKLAFLDGLESYDPRALE